MRVVVLSVGLLAGCSGSGLSAIPVDNPDALDVIPEAPPVEHHEDDEESPYAPAPEDDPTPPPSDPPDDPPADDPPADDPPEDTTQDPPNDPPPPPAPGCPAGVTCIDSFPHVVTTTTVGGTDLFDTYACAPSTNEAGPERIFEVTVDQPGFLAVTLWGMGTGVDIDAHILGSADGSDCIDRGHWDAGTYVQAGTYLVVADSWVDSGGQAHAGSFSMRIQHTPVDAFAGDGLSATVMDRALRMFSNAWHDGETSRLLYTVANYDLPSNQRRLWTFDLATGDLLFHEYVAHGSGSSGSNPAVVAQMSNTNGSHMSSVGLMRTAETYQGSNGYSMRLDGLESGYNDAVRPRAIVFHGADYATGSFVAANGYLGRSWGCPAVDPSVNAALIDTIKNGTLYLSHFAGDPTWVANTDYL